MKEPWSIKIQALNHSSGNNGYLVHMSGYEEPVVFSYNDNDPTEEWNEAHKECMTDVLYQIVNYFGLGYNGFEKKNLSIKWDVDGDEI
jgi:hypothetical protein